MDENSEKIVPKVIEEEMKQSYIDYAMTVIVSRALPDARDGLKPVHRRVLYTMYTSGLLYNKPFKKSANVVGTCMAKYHPHGDSAIYDTLVRLAQDFSLRYPLVKGQGNFGSIDGDSAAAMRYTEAKLNKLSEELLQDIEKETVKFAPNFDGSIEEPTVLPSKAPNLLVNGSSGIAVGMTTNIPPHNMGEICNAVIKLVENPETTIPELNQIVKGPDFPTGALICGNEGIKNAYKTGRGKVTVRAKTTIEDGKKKTIIVNEVPYQVNKAMMIEQIANLVRDKKIVGISDIRDESDRDGIRVVIELKQNANPDVVLNQLYKHSRMQVTFGIIFLALVNNEPKTLNLKQLMEKFLEHRVEIINNRTKYDLTKAEERAHLLAGLIVALDDIDNAIRIIKQSKNADIAKESLIKTFKIDEVQAKAILDMRLQRLTSLEQDKIREEQKELKSKIDDYKNILSSKQRVLDIIKDELLELKDRYGDERRTEIVGKQDVGIEEEDLIKKEDMVITVSHKGYVKRMPIDTYKQQKRGGRGVIGAGTTDGDFLENLFVASTHANILFFTDQGKVKWLKVYQIPEAGRQSKGTSIVNLIKLDKNEKITAFVPVEEFIDGYYLVMATKKGQVKKTPLEEFSNPRKGGIRAITLEDDDALVTVVLTDGSKELILGSNYGMALKFKESDVRPMGRTAKGVRGIKLRGNDAVVGMVVVEDDKTIFTLTERGYGKRTKVDEYRLVNRGGVGVINIKLSEKNGKVVAIKSVKEDDGLMLISRKGIIIRTAAKGISVIGRNTQGVRVIRPDEGDTAVNAALIVQE